MRQLVRDLLTDAMSIDASPDTENKTTPEHECFIGLLVISDDPALIHNLEPKLQHLGLDPRWATSFDEALDGQRTDWAPEAVLLDLLVPRSERYSICREVRAALGLPVIMVDERRNDPLTTNLVADHYLEKPVTAESIWASVHAVISRKRPSGGAETGELLLFSDAKSAFIDGRQLELTCDEFALLVRLARSQGAFVSRSELLKSLARERMDSDPRLVDAHVVRLMVKLAARSSRRIVRSTSNDAYMLLADGT
jgi:DNA-binding response OmpR family regulator